MKLTASVDDRAVHLVAAAILVAVLNAYMSADFRRGGAWAMYDLAAFVRHEIGEDLLAHRAAAIFENHSPAVCVGYTIAFGAGQRYYTDLTEEMTR